MKITLEGAQAKVIVDRKIGNPFVIGIGVRQRDGLSTTLFNLVLHKALKNLEQSNTILNKLTQICGYADDILVIARSLPALEALCVELTFRCRINSHLPFAGIIRSSPYSTRFQDKG